MYHIVSLQSPTAIEIAAGDIVRVDVSFSYQGPAQDVPVYAGIGHYGLFGWNPVEPNENTTVIPVDSPTEFKVYTASVLITVTDNLGAGTYDIAAYVPGHEDDTFAWAENIATVAGGAGGFDLSSMMGMMMMLMMMGMVMPLMSSAMGEEEAEGAEGLEGGEEAGTVMVG